MIFGGLEKFSLIDYPGKASAIAFTVGCNFRCPYCHNPEIVNLTHETLVIDEKYIVDFLENRRGKLDALSITGGEPTLHKDLLNFMQKVKSMGFLIKLDSNGTRPQVLREALGLGIVDYLAMDIKAPFEKYANTTIRPVDLENIKESIELIKASGVDHEFRTTIVRSLLSKKDVERIGDIVYGAKRFYLQKFIPTKTNDPAYLHESTYSDEELEELREIIARNVGECGIR